MNAQPLRLDSLHLDQHEVPAIKGINVPAFLEPRLVGDLVDPARPGAEYVRLCLALSVDLRCLKGELDQTLGQVGHIGHARADQPSDLRVEHFANGFGALVLTGPKSEKPAAQTPDEQLLGRTVELHRQDIGMEVRERTEQGLGHRVATEVKEETEVGVVRQNDELGAALRLGAQRLHDFLTFSGSGHIARRIVGKIEQDDELVPALRVALERFAKARDIEAFAFKEGERFDLRAKVIFETQPVVAPELVG